MPKQKYEEYWKLTLAYTDFNSDKFRGTLKAIVDFIDNHDTSEYSSQLYEELQNEVSKTNHLDGASLRKSINQFVKLGFINSYIKSYNLETIEFLNAKTDRKRKAIYSKIIYKYASFNSSVTEYSVQKEINFLLKTLDEVDKLSKTSIIGLMNVDIVEYDMGYITQEELDHHTHEATTSGFIQRKYNQVQYFFNLLTKLDDLVFIDDYLYFRDDAEVIFGDDLKQKVRKRDGYLHRLYKTQLKLEVAQKLKRAKCMVEKLAYPSLVASHIKPFIDSSEIEAYDANNGLLLSRNMDILFDQGYITFSDTGALISSYILEEDVKIHLQNYNLDKMFINYERIQYLHYHRKNIFKEGTVI